MTDADAARARELFAALEPQLDDDPALARRVVGALEKASVPPRSRGRRGPAPIDPFAIFRQDPENLRPALEALDPEQLKDVISEHAMDSSRLALKWKTTDRLINFIADVVEQRMRKGAAFLDRTPDERKASDSVRAPAEVADEDEPQTAAAPTAEVGGETAPDATAEEGPLQT